MCLVDSNSASGVRRLRATAYRLRLALPLMCTQLFLLGTVVEAQRAGRADAEYRAGSAAYEKHRYEESIRHLDAALRVRPDWPEALNVKGAALAFSGHRVEGERLIRRALALKPNYESGWFNLGLAMELQKRFREAIDAYDHALRLVPTNAWSYYGQACASAGLHDANGAARYLKQAIKLSPACRRQALTEKDFAPVRSSPAFQAVLR